MKSRSKVLHDLYNLKNVLIKNNFSNNFSTGLCLFYAEEIDTKDSNKCRNSSINKTPRRRYKFKKLNQTGGIIKRFKNNSRSLRSKSDVKSVAFNQIQNMPVFADNSDMWCDSNTNRYYKKPITLSDNGNIFIGSRNNKNSKKKYYNELPQFKDSNEYKKNTKSLEKTESKNNTEHYITVENCLTLDDSNYIDFSEGLTNNENEVNEKFYCFEPAIGSSRVSNDGHKMLHLPNDMVNTIFKSSIDFDRIESEFALNPVLSNLQLSPTVDASAHFKDLEIADNKRNNSRCSNPNNFVDNLIWDKCLDRNRKNDYTRQNEFSESLYYMKRRGRKDMLAKYKDNSIWQDNPPPKKIIKQSKLVKHGRSSSNDIIENMRLSLDSPMKESISDDEFDKSFSRHPKNLNNAKIERVNSQKDEKVTHSIQSGNMNKLKYTNYENDQKRFLDVIKSASIPNEPIGPMSEKLDTSFEGKIDGYVDHLNMSSFFYDYNSKGDRSADTSASGHMKKMNQKLCTSKSSQLPDKRFGSGPFSVHPPPLTVSRLANNTSLHGLNDSRIDYSGVSSGGRKLNSLQSLNFRSGIDIIKAVTPLKTYKVPHVPPVPTQSSPKFRRTSRFAAPYTPCSVKDVTLRSLTQRKLHLGGVLSSLSPDSFGNKNNEQEYFTVSDEAVVRKNSVDGIENDGESVGRESVCSNSNQTADINTIGGDMMKDNPSWKNIILRSQKRMGSNFTSSTHSTAPSTTSQYRNIDPAQNNCKLRISRLKTQSKSQSTQPGHKYTELLDTGNSSTQLISPGKDRITNTFPAHRNLRELKLSSNISAGIHSNSRGMPTTTKNLGCTSDYTPPASKNNSFRFYEENFFPRQNLQKSPELYDLELKDHNKVILNSYTVVKKCDNEKKNKKIIYPEEFKCQISDSIFTDNNQTRSSCEIQETKDNFRDCVSVTKNSRNFGNDEVCYSKENVNKNGDTADKENILSVENTALSSSLKDLLIQLLDKPLQDSIDQNQSYMDSSHFLARDISNNIKNENNSKIDEHDNYRKELIKLFLKPKIDPAVATCGTLLKLDIDLACCLASGGVSLLSKITVTNTFMMTFETLLSAVQNLSLAAIDNKKTQDRRFVIWSFAVKYVSNYLDSLHLNNEYSQENKICLAIASLCCSGSNTIELIKYSFHAVALVATVEAAAKVMGSSFTNSFESNKSNVRIETGNRTKNEHNNLLPKCCNETKYEPTNPENELICSEGVFDEYVNKIGVHALRLINKDEDLENQELPEFGVLTKNDVKKYSVNSQINKLQKEPFLSRECMNLKGSNQLSNVYRNLKDVCNETMKHEYIKHDIKTDYSMTKEKTDNSITTKQARENRLNQTISANHNKNSYIFETKKDHIGYDQNKVEDIDLDISHSVKMTAQRIGIFSGFVI